MKAGAVILAAGYSSRMGEFKPLLKLQGETLLAKCVRTMKQAGVQQIVVVVGHNREAVIRETKRLSVQCVYNEDYDRGMFSSVKKGIAEIDNSDLFFVLPVDIPLIRPTTIHQMLLAYSGQKVIYPKFAGKCGHPPLISSRIRNDILGALDIGGLAAVLKQYPSTTFSVWDRFILMDADTSESFATLQQASLRYDILDIREAEILAKETMPDHLIQHGTMVAKIADSLAKALQQRANLPPLDNELLYSSALLHDICKGKPDHEKEGEILLNSLGLFRMAEVVGAHRDAEVAGDGQLDEKTLVCLADKMVHGSNRVSFQKRFQQKLHEYSHDEKALYWIHYRLNKTQQIKEVWEQLTGVDIEQWLDDEGF